MHKAPVVPYKAKFFACVNCYRWNKKPKNKTGSCRYGDTTEHMAVIDNKGEVMRRPVLWPDDKVKWRKWDFVCFNWSDHGEINKWDFKAM